MSSNCRYASLEGEYCSHHTSPTRFDARDQKQTVLKRTIVTFLTRDTVLIRTFVYVLTLCRETSSRRNSLQSSSIFTLRLQSSNIARLQHTRVEQREMFTVRRPPMKRTANNASPIFIITMCRQPRGGSARRASPATLRGSYAQQRTVFLVVVLL